MEAYILIVGAWNVYWLVTKGYHGFIRMYNPYESMRNRFDNTRWIWKTLLWLYTMPALVMLIYKIMI